MTIKAKGKLKPIHICVLCDGWHGKHNKGCVWVKYMSPRKGGNNGE